MQSAATDGACGERKDVTSAGEILKCVLSARISVEALRFEAQEMTLVCIQDIGRNTLYFCIFQDGKYVTKYM